MRQNPLVTAAQLDKIGLNWIWDFGFLRPQELGNLLWPKSTHSTKNAERIARKWLADGLILRRTLPKHAGTVLVLSKAGAEFLSHEFGIDAKSGKDIGEMTAGVWSPPKTWRHDILAAGVLALMRRDGHTIYPEQKLRRENPNKLVPDGIALKIKDGTPYAVWLEIESARKTGKRMDTMCKSLIAAASGTSVKLSGITCTQAAVAYNPAQTDERDYSLDHHQRVVNALRKFARSDFPVHFLELKKTGVGVASYTLKTGLIEADAVTQAVARMSWSTRKSDSGEQEHYTYIPDLVDFCYTQKGDLWIARLTLLDADNEEEERFVRFRTQKALKRYAAKLDLGLIKLAPADDVNATRERRIGSGDGVGRAHHPRRTLSSSTSATFSVRSPCPGT